MTPEQLAALLARMQATPPQRKVMAVDSEADDWLDEANRRIRFRMSAYTVDRAGEVLLPEGCDLRNFNPTIPSFWRHDYGTPGPGSFEEPFVRAGDGVYAWHRFADTGRGNELFTLYRDGHLRTCSVGYYELETDPKPVLPGQWGKTVKRWELVECSLCGDPCNREATVKAGLSDEAVKALWPEAAETEPAAAPESLDPQFRQRFEGNLRRAKGALEGIRNGLRHLARQRRAAATPEAKSSFNVTMVVRDEELLEAIALCRQLGELYRVTWDDDWWADYILGEPEEGDDAGLQLACCSACGTTRVGKCHGCPECHASACPACGHCERCGKATGAGHPCLTPPPAVCGKCACAHTRDARACPDCGAPSCPDCGQCGKCAACDGLGNQPGDGPLPIDCPACSRSWAGKCAECPQCRGACCPDCGYCATCGQATRAGVLAPQIKVHPVTCPHCGEVHGTRTLPAEPASPAPAEVPQTHAAPEPAPPSPTAPGDPSGDPQDPQPEPEARAAETLEAQLARLLPGALDRRRKAAIGGPR